MNLLKYRAAWLAVISLAALTPAAHASTLFTLNQDGCTGGCGTSPFATITLTQVNSTTVLVSEVLLNGDGFIKTGAGGALEFNLPGDPAITISNLTPGFSLGPAPATASTFSSFDYSVVCAGCGNGGSTPLFGPLTFDVQLTHGGPLSIASFSANDKGIYFASDIIGTNGGTGNVAALGGPNSAVPEPGSAFLLAGGGALLFLKRLYAYYGAA